jgi:hypothetical protein
MLLALNLLTPASGLTGVSSTDTREAPRKIVRRANLLLGSYTIGTDSYRLVRAGVKLVDGVGDDRPKNFTHSSGNLPSEAA